MSSFGVSADESAEDTWASFDEIELNGGYNSLKNNRGDQFVPGSVTQGWMSTGKRTERNFSQQKQVITEGLNKTKEVVRREGNGWDMEDPDGGGLLLEVPGVDSSATEEEWGLRQTTPVGDGAVLLCNSRSKGNGTEDGDVMEVLGFVEGVAEQGGVKETILGEVAEGFEDLTACEEGGTSTGRSFAEPRNSSQTLNTYTTGGGSDTITEDLDSYLLGEGLGAGVWGEEGLEYSWDSINNLGNVNELFGGKMSLEGMRRSKSPPSPTGRGGGEGGGARGRLKIIVGQDQDDMGWMGMDLADDVLGVGGSAQGEKMAGVLAGLEDMEQGGMMDEGEDWKMAEGSPEMGQGERGEEFEMEMDGDWGEGRYKEDMMLEGDVGSQQISGGSNQVRSSGWPATELPEEGLAVPDLLPGDMLGGQESRTTAAAVSPFCEIESPQDSPVVDEVWSASGKDRQAFQEAQTSRKQQMLHKRKDDMHSGGQLRKAVQIRSSSPAAAAMNPAVQGQAASPVGAAETPVLMMPPKRQGRQSFGPGPSSGTQATTGVPSEGVPPQFMPMPLEGGGHMAGGGGGSSSRAPSVSAQQQPGPPRRQHLQQQHQQQQQQLRAQFQQQQQQLQLQQRQQQQLLNQQQRQQLTHQGTYQVRPSTPIPVSRGNRGMAHQQQQVYYPYPPQSAMGYPGVRGPQVMQPPPHQVMPPGMMVGPRGGGGMWGSRPMGMMPQSPSPPPMWDLEPQGTMVGSPGIVPVGENPEVGGVAVAAAAVVGSPVPEGEEDESVEAKVLKQLDQTMRALDVGTQLCIRDALYRLARSARERRKSTEQSSSGASGCGEPVGEGSSSGTGSQANNNNNNSNNNTTPPSESRPTSAASEPSMESGVPSTAAADMNAIDRSIVSLLFHLRKPRAVPVGAEPMLHPAPMSQQIAAVGGSPGCGGGAQYMVNAMVPQPMGQGPYPMGMGPGPMMPVTGPGPMGSWGWQHQGGGPVMAPMPARGGMQMMGPPAGVMVPTGMGMMGSMGMPPANPMGPPRPMLSRRTRMVPGGGKGGISGAGRGAWSGRGGGLHGVVGG